jgi:hypothetical protein
VRRTSRFPTLRKAVADIKHLAEHRHAGSAYEIERIGRRNAAAISPLSAYDATLINQLSSSLLHDAPGICAVDLSADLPTADSAVVAVVLRAVVPDLRRRWRRVRGIRLLADPAAETVALLLGPAFAFQGTWIAILAGQNSFLTLGLAGMGLALLDRRPWLAGMCIGLIAIKPQFGIVFPVVLVAGIVLTCSVMTSCGSRCRSCSWWSTAAGLAG